MAESETQDTPPNLFWNTERDEELMRAVHQSLKEDKYTLSGITNRLQGNEAFGLCVVTEAKVNKRLSQLRNGIGDDEGLGVELIPKFTAHREVYTPDLSRLKAILSKGSVPGAAKAKPTRK